MVEVTNSGQLKIVPETDAINNPGNIGSIRAILENDQGAVTGVPRLMAPEVDVDFRQRIGSDLMLDDVAFSYTAQDTGKHNYSATTMANTWTAGQLTTNSGSITTAATGTVLATYATFPIVGTQTLSADAQIAFTQQPVTNTFIEWGLGSAGGATVAPTDGAFFRLDSTGLKGIVSSNGTETQLVFPLADGAGTWAYTNNKRYQYIIYLSVVEASFWVNNGVSTYLLGRITLPTNQGRMNLARSAQYFIKHRIAGGAAGGVIQALVGGYSVRLGGSNLTTTPSTQGNRIDGSYQGFGGSTLGTLSSTGAIASGNEANKTAAVPNTTTAALGSGLGGTFWETATLAANTDAIIMSYQVPAATVSTVGKRLVVRGVYLSSYVQTAIVGGPYIAEFFLAFGHTSVSLGTAEAGATKAPRRITLPFLQQITAAQAVSTTVAQPVTFCDFGDAPIYVNPGEFFQLCTRHIGTVATAGTVVHRVTPVYGWE
jgi:hypothetical protein